MDGRRCFIRIGGWTNDVVLWVETIVYKDGWTDDVVL